MGVVGFDGVVATVQGHAKVATDYFVFTAGNYNSLLDTAGNLFLRGGLAAGAGSFNTLNVVSNIIGLGQLGIGTQTASYVPVKVAGQP